MDRQRDSDSFGKTQMKSSTLLFRQVHPSFIQNGEITSQVFRPTPGHHGCLSAYDGNLITAERSWEHYTNRLDRQSVGVVAVTVQECKEKELSVTPDPSDFPEHVLIDFSGKSRNQIDRIAKHLKEVSIQRGWQYRQDF